MEDEVVVAAVDQNGGSTGLGSLDPGDPRYRERPYRDEADWWAIRSLLVETFTLVPGAWNWDIRHWDGWRFHNAAVPSDAELAVSVGVWEDGDGRLVGAVHPDDPGSAVLELHPAHRTIESDMVAWAEANLARISEPGAERELEILVRDDDGERRSLLGRRGYAPTEDGVVHRRRPVSATDPERRRAGRDLPGGYWLRPTEPTPDDCRRMAELLNAAFRRTSHTAAEYETFIRRSPSFDPALNLVVQAPDGSFAAHVGFTYDDANRHGIVEPVCTHPDHRRLGLARLLIEEGLGRLAEHGAEMATVETGTRAAANVLYEACGFEASHVFHPWRRRLPPARVETTR